MSETEVNRRPENDARCPTCGASAHALSAAAQEKFGGQTHRVRGTTKALGKAWDESDRLANELDSTYAHLRAVIDNCKHSPVDAIRHQLVGLLPEVRTFDPDEVERFREKGLGHLVDAQEERARQAWAEYGYPPEEAAE